jgi:polysaccharide export outer membrane protein
MLMAGTAGCGATARSGPTASAILSAPPDGTSYQVVEITSATIMPFVIRAEGGAPEQDLAPLPSQFRIAAGDVLNIVVFERSDGGLFAPASTGGSGFPAVRVDEAGFVTLPYAGRVRVAGSTLAQAGARITAALDGTAIDPRVHVQLASSTQHSVLVSGEVRTPGRVTLLDGPLTALDAVARAGGPAQPAQALDAVIHGPRGSRRMSYLDLLVRPAMQLVAGEQVILEPNERRFLAMGAVLRPGLQQMTMSRMSLLDGLGLAGGLNDRAANPAGVFLFRLPEGRPAATTQPMVFHLDMARGEAMLLAHRFALQADDIVYVSNAPVWEVQKVIAPFLQLLTLGVAGAAAGG